MLYYFNKLFLLFLVAAPFAVLGVLDGVAAVRHHFWMRREVRRINRELKDAGLR